MRVRDATMNKQVEAVILSGQVILGRTLVLNASKDIARSNSSLSFVIAFIIASPTVRCVSA
jgi:hypothetical protein